MTDEEKEAIKNLKEILKYWQTIVDIEDDIEREIEMNCYFEEMPFKQLKVVLNLIEKQQKEIEELKESNNKLYEIGQGMVKQHKYTSDNYISKQKIRKKLDEQYELWNTPNKQKEYSQEIVNILEELLE